MPNYVYIATSLDGFIADRDGGLEWLTGLPDPRAATSGSPSSWRVLTRS